MKLADEKRALQEISQTKRARRTVEGFQAEEDAIAADRAPRRRRTRAARDALRPPALDRDRRSRSPGVSPETRAARCAGAMWFEPRARQ